MRWVHGPTPGTLAWREQVRGAVLTIGNYDGLHRGHEAILADVVAAARAQRRPAVLMGFAPTPREMFAGPEASVRITRWIDRAPVLARIGVDAVWLLRFDAALAACSAAAFVERFLVSALGAAEIHVGDDFRFGHARSGDVSLLRSLGECHGFEVRTMASVDDGEARISSTRIRQALQAGRFEEAAQLLGRRYTLCGRVAHGDKRGRQIGFPTANIRLGNVRMALQGVYAGWVRFDGSGAVLPAVANIGFRPTVAGREQRLEAHLLDTTVDCYGARIEFEPTAFIRGEQRFSGLDALQRQIALDAEQARQHLAGMRRPT